MPGNIRIFDLNNWDTETLENSGVIPGWPDTNTQHRWKTRSVRLDGIISEYVRTTGSSGLTANVFFVFYHNVTAAGNVIVMGSNDDWGTTPFLQPMIRTGDLFVYVSSTLLTYDDFGFYCSDVTNPDGYIELGRIWLGEYYEPDTGYNPDNQFANPDPSIKLEADGGQVSILEREKFKTWLFPFDCIYDKARYDTFISRVGTSKEFVILKQPKGYRGANYPDPEDNSFYVSMPTHDEKPFTGTYYRAILRLQEER